MAQKDLPPIELPFQRSALKVVVLREETTSSRFSLKAEIDQFRFEEEEEAPRRLVEVLDSEGELDRSSATHSPELVIARVDTTSEEEEGIVLNPRKGLRDLMAERNKGFSSKDIPKSQVPLSLPPPPPSPITDLSLIPIPNLKKKRKEQESKEREVVPQKGTK